MNIEALRAKLKGLEEGKPKSKRWKPTGEHTVRLLPIPGDEDLAHVVKWHYDVGTDRPMYCPTTHGDECPFCEFAKTLKGWKDSKGRDKPDDVRKMDWELFKKLDAATKHYIPVVVRRSNSVDVDGPFLWELTPKTYQALFKICANDDWNDGHPEGGALKVLTSLTHALDVVVTLRKKGTAGNTTSFDLTEVEERKKFSAVFKGDEKAATALLERVPHISEIGKVVSTAEAQKVFDAWSARMTGGEVVANDSNLEHNERPPNRGAETAMTGGKSVDEVTLKLEALLSKQQQPS